MNRSCADNGLALRTTPGFQWLAGMRVWARIDHLHPWVQEERWVYARVIGVLPDGQIYATSEDNSAIAYQWAPDHGVPDIRDAATVGCLAYLRSMGVPFPKKLESLIALPPSGAVSLAERRKA